MTNRPPLRNLSPMSEPWGRFVENEIVNLRNGFELSESSSFNSGRSASSSIDNLSYQVSELYQQRQFSIKIPDISITPQQNSWVSASSSATIDQPIDAPRYAAIYASSTPATTSPFLDASLFLQIIIDGNVISRSQVRVSAASTPPEYLPSWSVNSGFQLKSGSVIQVSAYSQKFTAYDGSINISNILAQILPSQKI